MTTFADVLEALSQAPSNVERGTRFEELMVDYFTLDPTLASQYQHVSRWVDWSHRGKSPDVGIDLVAQDRLSGEWTAIQCKFFARNHYLQKRDIDSFFTASGKKWNGVGFSNRIIISTAGDWSPHAEEALDAQQIPVQRLGVEQIEASTIDWVFTNKLQVEVDLKPHGKFALRPHQVKAIAAITDGFQANDRGQWISACGTGKTFTSLKLAEQLADANGGALRVIFLAPSIQLVAQTLREWTAQSAIDLRAAVVCSDTKASRAAEDISPHDLPLPATTDAAVLHERLAASKRASGLQVVFSTYQSLDVVAQAQALGAPEFDLILCDEAHRTTGVTLAGEDESSFVKVHDASYLRGRKRLYMTATPRIFGEQVVARAEEYSAVLSSMDDAQVFGPVFHRLGFGEAVEAGLLTDYKVMVLVVAEEQMAGPVQQMMADDNVELPLDDAAKIMGCWNTLAKRTHVGDEHPAFPPGAVPMKRAVGFLANIKSSQRVAGAFEQVVEAVGGADASHQLAVEARHVDGTMNALVRARELNWLKAPLADGQCRILTNARCLSEGVDVPALDAVMFLSPRNSSVDVVQSVGRVMRRAPGKDFGYIVLPVAVPVGVDPADALRNNKRFRVVWDVLNALRAHDDRFEAIVQSINLNGGRDTSGRIIIDTPDQPATDAGGTGLQMPLFGLEQWRDAIYSRIVDRVGTREYWDQWAADVSLMSSAQIARINALLDAASPEITAAFGALLGGLRANLNEAIGREDAISMLSQHLITAPVFDALFGKSDFAAHNPVSIGMQQMLNVLDGQGLEVETEQLGKFYESVRRRAAAVTDAAGRQAVIHDLYEKFFKNAFPKQAASLGVVYTPVEIVDFILRSADQLSRAHFGQGLTDEGVAILDPFTGTGTFIVRLLESGLLTPHDLARKYASELWCNEIMLLAYYIACVNIEATYESLIGSQEYLPFPGAIMTDTFQISEAGDRADSSLLPANSERIEQQLAANITVIVGNPPYSVGQSSANDNNANLRYPTLDARIADTYVKRSKAKTSRTTYDSYIRALRWATDRVDDRGIVAYVIGGGWLRATSSDGMRLALAEDFNSLWVFDLRGNQKFGGDYSRREGGKVFGAGSRSSISIVLAVKDPLQSGECRIWYRDIGDFLSREEKLRRVQAANIIDDQWVRIEPNPDGDWLGLRSDLFQSLVSLGQSDLREWSHFLLDSLGLATNRDAWCYNFSPSQLLAQMNRLVETYNSEAGRPTNSTAELTADTTKIKWTDTLKSRALKGLLIEGQSALRRSMFRPFTRQWLYFDSVLNHRPGLMARLFPTPSTTNVGFIVTTPRAEAGFAVLAVDSIPDLSFYTFTGRFYPRFSYEPAAQRAARETLFEPDEGEVIDGYRRIDNITDAALSSYREAFGPQVTKDEIFGYVYGVLHSPQYRERFAADLKKMLPRIPLAATADDFQAFVSAGQQLMALHIGYEDVELYPLEEQVTAPFDLDEAELYRVETKMKFAKSRGQTDRSSLIYNRHVTLRGIPDVAHDYQLGSRSALEWIIDRYYIRTDKPSGIVNDPNSYSDDPRYIIDLVKRVVTVSVQTMRIVAGLPALPLEGDDGATPASEPHERAARAQEADADELEPTPEPVEPVPASTLDPAPNDDQAASEPAEPASPHEHLLADEPEEMDADEWSDWFEAQPAETVARHREDVMISGLRAGLTLQEVGDRFGVTRARIGQVVTKRGLSTRELRKEQKAQRERRERRLARRIYGTSLTYPELDLTELADWWETDEATVRKALGHRVLVHEVRGKETDLGRTSEEDLLAALAEWGAQTDRLVGDDYNRWAAERGIPGKQTVANRFGSWNTALALAGLGDQTYDRGGLRPTISDEALWASVLEFFRADLPNYSFQGYEDFARQHGLGSGALLRQRLGTWTGVRERVRELLRYSAEPDGSWEWGEMVLAVSPRDQPRASATRESAIAALQRVAGVITGPVTVQAYENARNPDEPQANLVQKRCGSWIHALHLAGLDHRMSAKARGKLARGEVVLD